MKALIIGLLLWSSMFVWSVAAQTTKLKVAYPTTVGSMGGFVGEKDAKLFDKHGRAVELIHIAGNSRGVQAMLAKDISTSELAIPR